MAEQARLSGATALVTGAGSGIGRAVAHALGSAGMALILVGRREAALRETAASCDKATVIAADLSTEEGLMAVAGMAASLPLRALVHCAGAFAFGQIADTPREAWQRLAATNLFAPMRLTALCREPLRAGAGHVVFVNSTAGLRGTGSGNGAYAASKLALKGAVDTLRQELNEDGIRATSIFPGRTDTPMQDEVLAAEGRRMEPGNLLLPEDVASVILAALILPERAEMTDITIRPARDSAGRRG